MKVRTAEYLGLAFGGYSIVRRPPGGEDRTNDVVQMWLDGKCEEAVKIAEERAVMYSSDIDKKQDRTGGQPGRPCTVDKDAVIAAKRAGLTIREIAERCSCGITSVKRIWRQCQTK